jgi:hypothetical protein
MLANALLSFQTFICSLFLPPRPQASSISHITTSSTHRRSMYKISPHFSIVTLSLQHIVVMSLFNCLLQQKVEL